MTKKMKAVNVGQLVDVPVYTFAGYRHGDNGTLFRPGVVTEIYVSTKGFNCAKVEYPQEGYCHTKQTKAERFKVEALREYIGVKCHQMFVNEKPDRTVFVGKTYGDEIEFLIDKGFVKTNVPE